MLAPALITDHASSPHAATSATQTRATISAFVVCMNEERNIRRCLSSLTWCDEIVVVDSGSTDRTVEICNEYGARIFQRPWPGHKEQKQFALEQCRSEWVLNIDADEEVSAELRAEVTRILSLPEQQRNATAGYGVSRIVHFLDRWWTKGGWYPEYRMRLFQRNATKWGGINPHEKALVSGATKRLRTPIFHYTYGSLKDQIDSLNKHSSLWAEAAYKQGRRSSLIKLILHPLARFIKFYLLRRGFLEGYAGFVVARSESFYTFLKYAKLWEIGRSAQR